jgi:hypothetical protein
VLKLILSRTEKKPSEYYDIFSVLPKKAKKNILKALNYKSEEKFKEKFDKYIIAYNKHCQDYNGEKNGE